MDVIKTQNQLLTHLPRDLSNLVIEYVYSSFDELEFDLKMYQDAILHGDAGHSFKSVLLNKTFTDSAKLKFARFLIDAHYTYQVRVSIDSLASEISDSLKTDILMYYLYKADSADMSRECSDLYRTLGRPKEMSREELRTALDSYLDYFGSGGKWYLYQAEVYRLYFDEILEGLQSMINQRKHL